MYISDRYLVTIKETVPRLEQYLKSISKQHESHWNYCAVLEYTFERLEVVFVKAFPETMSPFDIHHIPIDVKVVLYKPVNMHVLLNASITSNVSAETTFFGANLLPVVKRHGPRFCERISEVVLMVDACIRRSPIPVVFPADAQAVHLHDPDFRVSLPATRQVDGNPRRPRHPSMTRKTFQALLSAIPTRNQGFTLCQLDIKCEMWEFGILCGAVSPGPEYFSVPRLTLSPDLPFPARPCPNLGDCRRCG